MRKTISVLSSLALFTSQVLSQQYTVPANSAQTQIQSIVNQAASFQGSTVVTFQGTFPSWNTSINLPCPVGGTMILQGTPPSVNYGGTLQTQIQGPVPNGWAMNTTPGCANATIIQFLGWNGGRPGGNGGGGFLYLPQGTSNLTVQYNTFTGNQTVASPAIGPTSSFIWMAGQDSNLTSDNNVVIAWNKFGSFGDCSAVRGLFYYYPGGSYDSVGGYCNAVGVQTPTQNMRLVNNWIEWQEQGAKWYESSASLRMYRHANDLIANNHLAHIHRIGFEAQGDAYPTMSFINNDYESPDGPAYGGWGFSVPQNGNPWGSGGMTNTIGNVIIADTIPLTFMPGAIEFWGQGTSSNNLLEGHWGQSSGGPAGKPGNGGAITYGYTSNMNGIHWSANNNICMLVGGAQGCVVDEGYHSTPPSMTGNVVRPLAPIPSTSPTITQSTNQVTITDPGDISGVGPQGNVSIWYTLDGSQPVPGVSTLYTAPFSPPTGTTISAVGMWGMANQPYSYPAGYGYIPSPVITAVFNGTPTGDNPVTPTPVTPVTPTPVTPTPVTPVTPVTPTPVVPVTPQKTLVSAYLYGNNNANTMVVGRSLQFQCFGIYSDGTKAVIPNNQVTFGSSMPNIMTVSNTGRVTAIAPGVANVTAVIGNIHSSWWTITVSPYTGQKVAVNTSLSPGNYNLSIKPDGTTTITPAPAN